MRAKQTLHTRKFTQKITKGVLNKKVARETIHLASLSWAPAMSLPRMSLPAAVQSTEGMSPVSPASPEADAVDS